MHNAARFPVLRPMFKGSIPKSKREGIKGFVLGNGFIFDAVYSVDIFTVKKHVRVHHFPSMVFLDHRHPFAIRRSGDTTCINFPLVKECIASIDLLGYDNR